MFYFLSLQLHRRAVVNFVSIWKRIALVIGRHFVMSNLLLPKYITVTRCRSIVHTTLFQINSSLPIVDDKYSFTRAQNVLASLITPIRSLEPPSFWLTDLIMVQVVFANYLDLKIASFIYIENMWSYSSKES